jgi:biopolymer transport protein ExbD
MSNDNQSHSSSSGAVIAIVAVVVLLLLGGLVVLGLAGLCFLKLSPSPSLVVAHQVMAEPVQSADLAAEGQAPTFAEAPSFSADVRKITVKLDQQGKILADGQSVDLDGLRGLLVQAREGGKVRLEAVVEVDRQCLFQHVAAVQFICKGIGVENVQVQALTASPD